MAESESKPAESQSDSESSAATTSDSTSSTESTSSEADTAKLQSALKSEREARERTERELKAIQKKQAEIEAAQMSEHEKAINAAREEGKSEAQKAMLQQLAAVSVQAAAAGKLNVKAELVPRLFDLDDFIVDDKIDSAKIDAAVTQLLKDNPSLAATSSSTKSGPEHEGSTTQTSNGSTFGKAFKDALAKSR